MIHRWRRLELDNACRVNPNLYRWWLDLDNACHVNPILYRWWLYLVYVGRLYQADNSKRRVRRLTHQFGTEWQNYINLILLKDNDKWRRNNITFVTNLFPCLGFAPRSQSLACCAYAQAGSICSLSGFAHFVRVIRPQIRYSPKNN